MIALTRLNGTPLIVNSDLIKTAESSPDTMLTLITGEKLIVREECEEVQKRILAYRAGLLALVAQRMAGLPASLSTSPDLARVVSIASLPTDDHGNVTLSENRTKTASPGTGGTRY